MSLKNESENLSPAAENALRETMAALSPPKTVEEVTELLDLTEKGLVRNTVSNAEMILSYDPLLRDSVRYNELTQRVDVVKPMGWERGNHGPALTDNDIFNCHLYCDRTYGITAKALVEEAVNIVANRNAYHPIRDFLNSLEWDGRNMVKVEFSGKSAPYSAAGRYYLRTADEDREVTPEELRVFFGAYKHRDKWEKELSEATSKQIDKGAIKSFWQKAISAGRLPDGRLPISFPSISF